MLLINQFLSFPGRIETRPNPISIGNCGTKEGLKGLVDDVSLLQTLLRWPKWLTFHFHTTSQFRIPKFAVKISEFGI